MTRIRKSILNRINLKILIVISFPLVLIGLCGCSSISDGRVGIGNPAPDFQLQTTEGSLIMLSDLRGSPVILNFWASWCGPCLHEMPIIQQIHEDRDSYGVVLLTINLRQTLSTITQFMQNNNFSFPVLLDPSGATSLDYNVGGIPTTFFIDVEGTIKAMKLGFFNSLSEMESYLLKIQS
jgi:peroxiredoxin